MSRPLFIVPNQRESFRPCHGAGLGRTVTKAIVLTVTIITEITIMMKIAIITEARAFNR